MNLKLRHAIAILWRTLTAGQRRRFVILQFVSLLMAMSTSRAASRPS